MTKINQIIHGRAKTHYEDQHIGVGQLRVNPSSMTGTLPDVTKEQGREGALRDEMVIGGILSFRKKTAWND